MRGSPEKGELWDDKKGSMSYLFFIFLQLPSTMLRIQIGIPIKAVLNCSGDLILLFGGGGSPPASVSPLDNQGLLVWIEGNQEKLGKGERNRYVLLPQVTLLLLFLKYLKIYRSFKCKQIQKALE